MIADAIAIPFDSETAVSTETAVFGSTSSSRFSRAGAHFVWFCLRSQTFHRHRRFAKTAVSSRRSFLKGSLRSAWVRASGGTPLAHRRDACATHPDTAVFATPPKRASRLSNFPFSIHMRNLACKYCFVAPGAQSMTREVARLVPTPPLRRCVSLAVAKRIASC